MYKEIVELWNVDVVVGSVFRNASRPSDRVRPTGERFTRRTGLYTAVRHIETLGARTHANGQLTSDRASLLRLVIHVV